MGNEVFGVWHSHRWWRGGCVCGWWSTPARALPAWLPTILKGGLGGRLLFIALYVMVFGAGH